MIEVAVLSALLACFIVAPVAYYVGRYDQRLIHARVKQVRQAASGGVHMENVRANGDVIAHVEVSNQAEVDQ